LPDVSILTTAGVTRSSNGAIVNMPRLSTVSAWLSAEARGEKTDWDVAGAANIRLAAKRPAVAVLKARIFFMSYPIDRSDD